jgi:uncharacterized damage-inducible protein DinB
MSLSEMLLPEFDQETAGLRRTLERIPEDRFMWKPHEKSWTLGGLATHLANLPSWTAMTLTQSELDLEPEGQPAPRVTPLTTRDEVLSVFDKNVAEARAALAGADDATFGEPWTLLQAGKKIFTMPKGAVLRSFVFNHLVHHRAQLGVYLRLNDIPVPALYGPSADEEPQ